MNLMILLSLHDFVFFFLAAKTILKRGKKEGGENVIFGFFVRYKEPGQIYQGKARTRRSLMLKGSCKQDIKKNNCLVKPLHV